jgi:hypothetical protein
MWEDISLKQKSNSRFFKGKKLRLWKERKSVPKSVSKEKMNLLEIRRMEEKKLPKVINLRRWNK